jgi:hypothetical protein
MQRVEDLFLKLKSISEDGSSDSDGSQTDMQDKAVQMQKLINEFKKSNMKMSDEESQRLTELGEYLENSEESETTD